jgi:hypothetical protein
MLVSTNLQLSAWQVSEYLLFFAPVSEYLLTSVGHVDYPQIAGGQGLFSIAFLYTNLWISILLQITLLALCG